MTDEQRSQITHLRQLGMGYTAIATRIGLTKQNVKQYCRYHGLAGIRCKTGTPVATIPDTCLNCGSELKQTPGVKKRKFCCARCRQIWWNANQDKVVRKTFYSYACPACGKNFTAYGNDHRKYCSYNCYIAARFKGVVSI